MSSFKFAKIINSLSNGKLFSVSKHTKPDTFEVVISDEEALELWGDETPLNRVYWFNDTTQAHLLRKNIVDHHYKCCYCEIPLTKKNYTKEHLIPLSREGGTNKLANIKPCCSKCNHEKGNLLLSEYLEKLNIQPKSIINLIKIKNVKLLMDENITKIL